MTDNNLPEDINKKKSSQEPIYSLLPSTGINQIIISSRHPHITDNSHRTSMRSTCGSSSRNSRIRHTSNISSSIQMEPGLQALLIAEGQAAEMIAKARTKRNELLRQSNQESQIEIELFRQECENQYKLKLYQATQLEQYQEKLNKDKYYLFEEMENNFKNKRKSLIKYIIHCVIDQISVAPHPNTKRVMF